MAARSRFEVVDGQAGVPLFALGSSAVLIISSTAVPGPTPGTPGADPPAYAKLPVPDRSKGTRSMGTGTRSINEVKKDQPADVEQAHTAEETAAFAAVYMKMQKSVKFYLCDKDGNRVPTLVVQFIPEEQNSEENRKMGAIFRERNDRSGDCLRTIGRIIVTGELGPDASGMQLKWDNAFHAFKRRWDTETKQYVIDPDGDDLCSYSCNVYFMTTECPARDSEEETTKFWIQDEIEVYDHVLGRNIPRIEVYDHDLERKIPLTHELKKKLTHDVKMSWPAKDLEEYEKLKHPLHFLWLYDLWQWNFWNDNSQGCWKLEGCDTEALICFTGPDVLDKYDEERSSLIYPRIIDTSQLITDHVAAKDDEMVVGGRQDVPTVGDMDLDTFKEGLGVASKLVMVRGTVGEVQYNTNKEVSLFEGCPEDLCAFVIPIEFRVTMAVKECSNCFEIHEAGGIGFCGHTFCTVCLGGLETSGHDKCPMCRGAKKVMKRTEVHEQDLAKQLAASAAEYKKRTAGDAFGAAAGGSARDGGSSSSPSSVSDGEEEAGGPINEAWENFASRARSMMRGPVLTRSSSDSDSDSD